MLSYGVTDIQTKPSLIKTIGLGEIVDKRAHTRLGYFIASKYEKYIKDAIEKIEHDEKMAKLQLLKNHQDLEFCELGVDDGLA